MVVTYSSRVHNMELRIERQRRPGADEWYAKLGYAESGGTKDSGLKADHVPTIDCSVFNYSTIPSKED